ncbi:alpha-hydroxy acid oxidase [Carnimonas nigrificans]|uniref:alpha-hydroxy acid oxidase n=1 Tax=Carnimonas nigrificans TaxID=64323 RepID=UPI001FDFDA68|nr:alpha-hydroxy acid oxidase [Carnimonas nigrificans]
MRAVAKRRVPNFCFEFLDGGAEDETSLRRNRSVFSEIGLRPHALVDISQRHTSTSILGEASASPFMIGPTGFSGLLSDKGDLALASAASDSNIPYVLSNVSTVSIEEICEATNARVWMQVYMYRNREFVERMVDRLLKTRVDTLVFTIDNPVHGKREWDVRCYRRPLKLTIPNMLDAAMHPRWLLDVLWPNGVPRFANLGDLLPPGQDDVRGAAQALASQLSASLSWEDVRWLRERWPHKLIIKGLLNKDDVLKAADYGADSVILSNHGGRQLDGALSAMEVLPEVIEALNGRIPVIVDGGFRRGSDIVKAIALGAEAVSLGRATSYGVAAAGQQGVQRVINILNDEIDRVLGLLGCNSLAELTPDHLEWRR